jgi:hypothetical protein
VANRNRASAVGGVTSVVVIPAPVSSGEGTVVTSRASATTSTKAAFTGAAVRGGGKVCGVLAGVIGVLLV